MAGNAKGSNEGFLSPRDIDAMDNEVEEAADETESSWLDRFMFNTLAISSVTPEQLLPEVTIQGVAKFILSDRCKNIVTVSGKGISSSAGYPDHMSQEDGLYNNIYKYTSSLTAPEDLFTLKYFKKTPRPFFILAKQLLPDKFKPTPCHYFIKLINDKGKLLRHYTQNIDSLERASGLDVDKIVEVFGTFRTSHCQRCGKEFNQEWIKNQILSDVIPRCDKPNCHGVVKPDILFFGEGLTDRFTKGINEDMAKCDLLIVIGSTLVGQPFSTMTSRVSTITPRLYINPEKGRTGLSSFATLMYGGGGFNFDDEYNYRDVFLQGPCDDGCYILADLLGWGTELKKMVEAQAKSNIEIAESEESANAVKKTVTKAVCSKMPKPEDKTAHKRKSSQSTSNNTSESKQEDKKPSKPESKTALKSNSKTISKIKNPSFRSDPQLKVKLNVVTGPVSKSDSTVTSKADGKIASKLISSNSKSTCKQKNSKLDLKPKS